MVLPRRELSPGAEGFQGDEFLAVGSRGKRVRAIFEGYSWRFSDGYAVNRPASNRCAMSANRVVAWPCSLISDVGFAIGIL